MPGVRMRNAGNGWVAYTIKGQNGRNLEFVFTDGYGRWDNNFGRNYKAAGRTIVVNGGRIGNSIPDGVSRQ